MSQFSRQASSCVGTATERGHAGRVVPIDRLIEAVWEEAPPRTARDQVRIAGARLASRPHWTVSQLTYRPADESRRLDELEVGTLQLRGSIEMSYLLLTGEGKRLFRLLSVLPALDFPGWLAAALRHLREPGFDWEYLAG